MTGEVGNSRNQAEVVVESAAPLYAPTPYLAGFEEPDFLGIPIILQPPRKPGEPPRLLEDDPVGANLRDLVAGILADADKPAE